MAQEIRVIEPFLRAYERTAARLFQPFAWSTWLLLGVSSWLANLGGGCHGGFNVPGRGLGSGGDGGPDAVELESLWHKLQPYLTLLLISGAVLLLCLVVVAVVLSWVKARFEFVFLDNLLGEHTELARPWEAYRQQGNSLFLWRFGYSVCLLLLLLVLLVGPGLLGYQAYREQALVRLAVIAIVTGLILLPVLLLNGFILAVLRDFVVPLMYRYRLTTGAGWAAVWPHLKTYLWHFLLYYLFVLLLRAAVAVAVTVLGCLTCCLGFLLLALPYVGAVLLLPVECAFRFLSLEFLDQFSPAYQFGRPATPPPAPPALPT